MWKKENYSLWRSFLQFYFDCKRESKKYLKRIYNHSGFIRVKCHVLALYLIIEDVDTPPTKLHFRHSNELQYFVKAFSILPSNALNLRSSWARLRKLNLEMEKHIITKW